jgi:hypothetical protein
MPKEVFRQLMIDHSLTAFTQERFGHLNLHQIRWDEVTLPAIMIAAASYEHGSDNVGNSEHQTEQVPGSGWKPVTILSRRSKRRWQERRTWLDLPLFVEGSLVGLPAAMHLIEGHRRLGALRGLLKSGWLEPASEHRVWLGRVQNPPIEEGEWRNVVRDNPIPFAVWLTRFRWAEGEVGKIGEEFDEMSRGWELFGVPDTSAAFDHVHSHPELGGMHDTLKQLWEVWIEYTNP